MAYIRGAYYFWRDEQLHLWAADGYDGWDESGWAEAQGTLQGVPTATDRPSGVAIPQAVADEYVVMRFAELVREGEIGDVIDRALADHGGNGGALALSEYGPALREALQRLSRRSRAE
jgi:hypothetical protein